MATNEEEVEKQQNQNQKEASKDQEELKEDSSESQQEEELQEKEAPEVSELDSLKAELEATNDKYVRLMAEFENYKKRASRDYERLVETANEKLMLELVEVRENFERAIKAAEQGGELKQFLEGTELIYTKFVSVLEKNGLQAFGEPGEEFDPQIHDALMKADNEKIPEDHIAEVFERGYKIKERVVKHARVIVSSGSSQK
ncbi:nucleotide exchange factor GrpE [Chitinispirillales bacterium ANBcel5]|uniref:nucleotide exchange factor GrpE n=1 Tax=Cellulosispirillum alkaliphilum TaxID=3039283 RepID=UPI002A4F1E89|nr:nucleotide exchange factor GrpE [Chitinispirillales bacterium ANBcel5]